jgi:ABC-type amino acid transport substrate-binding protein
MAAKIDRKDLILLISDRSTFIRRSRIIVILFALFSLTGTHWLTTTVFAADQPQEIRVGFVTNGNPVQYLDEKAGKPSGYAIDVLDEILKTTGLKANYMAFDDIPLGIQALKEGRIDILPGIIITEKRKKEMDFTSPIDTVYARIFVKKSNNAIKDIHDLKGKNVAVVAGSMGTSVMEKFGEARPIVYKSVEEAILSLLAGNTDALVHVGTSVRYMTRKADLEGRIKLVGEPLLEAKRAIAVGKGKNSYFLPWTAVSGSS